MVVVGILGFLGFLIGLIALAIKSKKKDKLGKTIIITGLLFIIMMIGFTNASEDKPTTKSTSATNTTADTSTKEKSKKADLQSLVAQNFKDGKVIKNGEELTIQFTPDALTENTFVTISLNSIAQGFNKIYKNEEFKKFEIIHVKVMAKFNNEYGAESEELGMELAFNQDALQKVQSFDNMLPEQLVKLQGEYRTGVAESIRKNLSPENLQILYPND